MKNDGRHTSIKKCLKTKRMVEVVLDRAADENLYVRRCLDKSDRCYGLGCFLVEFGGDWPFADSE